MGLFKPAWQSRDHLKRAKAVAKLDDQKILADIARNDQNASVREEAIKKLTNTAVLSTATKEEIALAAIIAVKKIGDTSVLIAAGQKSPYEKVAKEAAEALLENSVFTAEELAGNPAFAVSARVAAISLVSNQDFCVKLAENDPNKRIRKAAKHMVTDPVIRREYCKEGIHEWEDVGSDYDEVGEHVYASYKQRCKYCGIEKTEKETRRL